MIRELKKVLKLIEIKWYWNLLKSYLFHRRTTIAQSNEHISARDGSFDALQTGVTIGPLALQTLSKASKVS